MSDLCVSHMRMALTYYEVCLVMLSVLVLYSAIVGDSVRNQARTEPPPSFGDPEIDAAVQFARLVGVQSGYS